MSPQGWALGAAAHAQMAPKSVVVGAGLDHKIARSAMSAADCQETAAQLVEV